MSEDLNNNEDVYYNKGVALLNLGRYEEAIKCFDEVMDLNPNNVDAYNNKELALDELNKSEQALECYEKVKKSNSNTKDDSKSKSKPQGGASEFLGSLKGGLDEYERKFKEGSGEKARQRKAQKKLDEKNKLFEDRLGVVGLIFIIGVGIFILYKTFNLLLFLISSPIFWVIVGIIIIAVVIYFLNEHFYWW